MYPLPLPSQLTNILKTKLKVLVVILVHRLEDYLMV